MKAVTVRFSDDLHEALRKESYEYKRSINDIITNAVEEHLGDSFSSWTQDGERGGYTVRPSKRGWIVERWSRVQGAITDSRHLVAYSEHWPEGADLGGRWNDMLKLGDVIAMDAPVARVLKRGCVVE